MKKPTISGRTPVRSQLEVGKTYYFCTCGLSRNQPFCDSSHRDTDFSPKAFTVDESNPYYLCACKQSAKQPFCDGTHSTLNSSE